MEADPSDRDASESGNEIGNERGGGNRKQTEIGKKPASLFPYDKTQPTCLYNITSCSCCVPAICS